MHPDCVQDLEVQDQGDILGLPGSDKGRMEGSLDHDG